MASGSSKIGLALSGGAALGMAHVGVLQAFKDNEIEIGYISGTSAGAFAAALYAFRTDLEKVREYAKELRWFNLSGLRLSKYGIVTTEGIGKLIEELIGKKKIEDASIPLAMIATDVTSGDKVVLTKGDLAEAVMASCCIPGIFTPVAIGKRMLVDGGLVENVPVSPLQDMGAHPIIAVDLSSKIKLEQPKEIIGVIVNSITIGIRASRKINPEHVDVLIEPKLDAYKGTDLKNEADLFTEGYRAAEEKLDEIQKLVKEKSGNAAK